MLRSGACVSSLVSTLNKFVETLPGTKQRFAVKAALDAWFHEADRADWRTPADAKANYATASIVDGERVVFNIKGNDYRLVTATDYSRRTVFVKWLGSHGEYDKIDVRNVRYGDQAYQKR
jgi:mRNA interferase HigB